MEIFKHLPEEEDGRKEWLHQQDCFSWVITHYPHLVFAHISNETGVPSSAKLIDRRSRAGVVKGASDNMILSPTTYGVYPFSMCELKRPDKKAKVSPEQVAFGERVESNGGLFVVCYGHLAFRRFINKYYCGSRHHDDQGA